jgi:hypothetical protein
LPDREKGGRRLNRDPLDATRWKPLAIPQAAKGYVRTEWHTLGRKTDGLGRAFYPVLEQFERWWRLQAEPEHTRPSMIRKRTDGRESQGHDRRVTRRLLHGLGHDVEPLRQYFTVKLERDVG